jgi:uncharacterized protein (UPF0332 family)
MEHLLNNAREFLESGRDNLEKERFNASTSDFFKAIVVFCDYLIYCEIKRVPKNHKDRFNLLEVYFNEIYQVVAKLFKPYTDSYNLKSTKEDSLRFKKYAEEIEEFVRNKERA